MAKMFRRVLIAVVSILAAWAVILSLYLTLPAPVKKVAMEKMGIPALPEQRPDMPQYNRLLSSPEWVQVNADHFSAQNWIAECLIKDDPGNVRSAAKLPPEIFWTISLPFQSPYYEGKPPELKRSMNRLEVAMAQFSRTLSMQRLELALKVRDSFQLLQITTWITVLIGMVTTVLVSLSSTSFGSADTLAGRTIRVFAIIFPAVGTAAAAVIAFYGPREELGRASHTLAGIKQLHAQIVQEIPGLDCADDPGDKEKPETRNLLARLGEWSRRYQDILAVADTAAGSSGEQGQGAGRTQLQSSPPTGSPQAPSAPPR